MIDLIQLAEDSFASAFRRYPYSSSDDGIKRIYEEVHELEYAYLDEDPDRHHLSTHCPELTSVEEELADVILSCLVFAKLENIDIDNALGVKNEYNKTRL